MDFHDEALERPSRQRSQKLTQSWPSPLGWKRPRMERPLTRSRSRRSHPKGRSLCLGGRGQGRSCGGWRSESGGDQSVGVAVAQAEPDPVYELPTLSLLDKHDKEVGRLDEALRQLAKNLEQKLADFGGMERSPSAQGRSLPSLNTSRSRNQGLKISNLSDDIATAMRAFWFESSLRSPKGVVGIEIPNKSAATVWFRHSGLERVSRWGNGHAGALGRPDGSARIADLARCPTFWSVVPVRVNRSA